MDEETSTLLSCQVQGLCGCVVGCCGGLQGAEGPGSSALVVVYNI